MKLKELLNHTQIEKMKEYRTKISELKIPVPYLEKYIELANKYDTQNVTKILDLQTNIDAWECIVLGERIDNDLLVNEKGEYYSELNIEDMVSHILTINAMYKQVLSEKAELETYCKKLELLLTPKDNKGVI